MWRFTVSSKLRVGLFKASVILHLDEEVLCAASALIKWFWTSVAAAFCFSIALGFSVASFKQELTTAFPCPVSVRVDIVNNKVGIFAEFR